MSYPLVSAAAIELVKDETPAMVFAGGETAIRVLLHNPTDKQIEQETNYRLYQVSSSTRVPVGEAQPWQTVRILPGQTIVEQLPLTLPEIRAATVFQVDLSDIGKVTIVAHPPELLKQLATLGGDKPLGVYDPEDKLRGLLKRLKIDHADFESQPEDCRLAIVWTRDDKLPESVSTRVRKGMALVWIRPQKGTMAYVTSTEAGAVVNVPAANLARLADSAMAQVNLIRFAELAVQPETGGLPNDR